MKDKDLLEELLNAETESAALQALLSRGLLDEEKRWRYLGNMPNNQSIVLAQQSTPAAALVEKFTNSIDAVLLRHCKREGVDPRSAAAPSTMAKATERYFGDISSWSTQEIRALAEDHVVLYATGSKLRPSLSIYDAGEGQHAKDFPSTFCSLISGTTDGSYKGAIPFVQGRFNMGGTGVLPFCGEERKLQLIVSRVPDVIAGSSIHEWAFTIFCFFPSKQNPSWKYLVGSDGAVMTAASEPLKLLPKAGAKSGEVVVPRERSVPDGTLVKMYDFKAARSNICGEQFKKLQDYLLKPALPLRVMETRSEYKAKVMGVTIWDRLEAWGRDKLEHGFEEGASISVELATGESVPAEVRVFKAMNLGAEENLPQTGLRALINGQSHAKRDAHFFKTKAVDLEHIAGSMLVTLDCTELGQDSRNAIFMSNRETFREDPLLTDLLKKLQKELKEHEGLQALNLRRYEEKVQHAVSDDEGVSALEELLASDPTLAEMFGGIVPGKVAAKTAEKTGDKPAEEEAQPFEGLEFPTFISRKDGATKVTTDAHRGSVYRVSFITDVKNNYFSRAKFRGSCSFAGDINPSFHIFNGRLTFAIPIGKGLEIGRQLSCVATITDKKGSGPFVLQVELTVLAEREEAEKREPRRPPEPTSEEGPSRPNIKEAARGPEQRPLSIEKDPGTARLQLILNTTSQQLTNAKSTRPAEEEAAVSFVFKYGLALIAMSLLEAAKRKPEWTTDEVGCRELIEVSVEGISRIIVPLCLSLPKSLPRSRE